MSYWARVLGLLSRIWLGLAYGIVLLISDTLLSQLSADDVDAVEDFVSTNMDNMTSHPQIAIIASAMMPSTPFAFWLPLLVIAVAACQWWIGVWRTLLLCLLGNALPTAVTMASIRYGLHVGWYSNAVRSTDDFGISYVMFTLLGALVFAIPFGVWRLLYVAGLMWLLLAVGVTAAPVDISATGHLASAIIGVGCGYLLSSRRMNSPAAESRPTPPASST
jgi:hypothetical protein